MHDTSSLDDVTLNLLDHALGASFDGHDEDGNPILVGADMTLPKLLEFLSGYDPTLTENIDPAKADDYPGVIWSIQDVLRALIAEIRRLRSTADGGPGL